MWERKMMGPTESPYHACQAVTWAKSISMGDRLESNNHFAWDKVVLNLPVTKEYDFQRPWLFKKVFDGLLAMDLFIYVDYGQPNGPTGT